MKIFGFPKLLFLILIPVWGWGQSENLFKKDSINLCVLKLDFLSYNFEGGNMSYYKKCLQSDTLPFVIDFQYPVDFGGIKFKTLTNLDVIFDASIVWMGTGKLRYPINFSQKAPFDTISKKASKPTNLEYFNWKGSKIFDDTVFIKHADSAWDAISALEITNKFSELDSKFGIYLYAPSVGLFNPSVAKWIVFLYQSNTNLTNISSFPIEKNLIYPSPFQDLININTAEKFDFKIFNLNGILVQSGVLKNNQIELNDLSQGLYYLSLTNDNQTINRVLIKK